MSESGIQQIFGYLQLDHPERQVYADYCGILQKNGILLPPTMVEKIIALGLEDETNISNGRLLVSSLDTEGLTLLISKLYHLKMILLFNPN